jgi:hypothetical protein
MAGDIAQIELLHKYQKGTARAIILHESQILLDEQPE